MRGELVTVQGMCPVRDACIAHCVSADGAMGAGFAAQIDRIHRRLYLEHVDQLLQQGRTLADLIGHVIYTHYDQTTIAHLITKLHHYDKPTIDSFIRAVVEFVQTADQHTTTQPWHSPRLGCGLDRLSWDRVEVVLRQAVGQLSTDWVIHLL